MTFPPLASCLKTFPKEVIAVASPARPPRVRLPTGSPPRSYQVIDYRPRPEFGKMSGSVTHEGRDCFMNEYCLIITVRTSSIPKYYCLRFAYIRKFCLAMSGKGIEWTSRNAPLDKAFELCTTAIEPLRHADSGFHFTRAITRIYSSM